MLISKLPYITKQFKRNQIWLNFSHQYRLQHSAVSVLPDALKKKNRKGSKHKRENYLCGPFAVLTCPRTSSAFLFFPSLYVEVTPNGHWLDELSGLRKAGASQTLSWATWLVPQWSLWPGARWRSKPSVTAAGGSFPLTHHFFYTSEFKMSLKRILIKLCKYLNVLKKSILNKLVPQLSITVMNDVYWAPQK